MVRDAEFMGIPVLVATPEQDVQPAGDALQVRDRLEAYMKDREAFLASVDETTRARMSARPASRPLDGAAPTLTFTD